MDWLVNSVIVIWIIQILLMLPVMGIGLLSAITNVYHHLISRKKYD